MAKQIMHVEDFVPLAVSRNVCNSEWSKMVCTELLLINILLNQRTNYLIIHMCL